MLRKSLLVLFCTLPLLAPLTNAEAGIEKRAEVRQFIDQMVSRHGMSKRWLEGVFAHTEIQQSIIDAMNRPAEKTKPWHEYRAIFLTDKRIRGGVKFWNDNAALLAEVEKKYQVPAEIIVAIIGVETFYGGNVGRYKVTDALATLTFAYPKRAKFFRKQLEAFLVICHQEKLNPNEPVGSYAGAMGLPQFIPTSLQSFAVDHDGDGRHDLWHSLGDIIASVANYFAKHHWQWGGPVTTTARAATQPAEALLERGFKPHTSLSALTQRGISPAGFMEPSEAVGLLSLEGANGDELWITASNFYVITRYNHSPMYAMAVYQLSEAIRSARAQPAQDS